MEREEGERVVIGSVEMGFSLGYRNVLESGRDADILIGLRCAWACQAGAFRPLLPTPKFSFAQSPSLTQVHYQRICVRFN